MSCRCCSPTATTTSRNTWCWPAPSTGGRIPASCRGCLASDGGRRASGVDRIQFRRSADLRRSCGRWGQASGTRMDPGLAPRHVATAVGPGRRPTTIRVCWPQAGRDPATAPRSCSTRLGRGSQRVAGVAGRPGRPAVSTCYGRAGSVGVRRGGFGRRFGAAGDVGAAGRAGAAFHRPGGGVGPADAVGGGSGRAVDRGDGVGRGG